MSHSPRCNHILLVEDDTDIREAVQDVLESEGYQVATARNGKEALDQLRSAPVGKRPCFILLDLMMPVMNGWEFLLAQRSDPELARIPVMIASAVAEKDKFPGITESIRKPYELEELLSLVRKHCDLGGRPEDHLKLVQG